MEERRMPLTREEADIGSGSLDDTFNSRRRISSVTLDENALTFGQALFDPKSLHSIMLNDEKVMGTTVEELRAQLEECLELLRQVDSERCSLMEKTEQMQKVLDAETSGNKAMRSQIIDSHRELRKAQRSAMEAKAKVREMEESLASATEDQLRLRRFLRSLPVNRDDTLVLVPDRRFEEAFRDKMSAIRYKRRYEHLRQVYERRLEIMETEKMTIEDSYVASGRLDGVPFKTSDLQFAEDISLLSTTWTLNDLGSSNALSSSKCIPFYGTNGTLTFPFQIPFSHVTGNDSYIKSQIHRSAYREQLTRLQSGVFRLSHRLKHLQEVGLGSMYGVMLEVAHNDGSSSFSPSTDLRKTFEAAMEKTQYKQRDTLYELVELVNSSIGELLKHESRSVSKPFVSKRDAGCSVYFTTPVDLRLADIEARLELHRRREMSSMEAGKSVRVPNVEREDTVMRQKALLTLQQLVCLHKSFSRVTQSLLALCPMTKEMPRDAFVDLSLIATENTLDDPRFETKIAEAVEVDVQCADRLANYAQLTLTTASSSSKKKKQSTDFTAITLSRRKKSASGAQDNQKRRISQPLSVPLCVPRCAGVNSRRMTEDLTATHPFPSKMSTSFQKRFTEEKTSANGTALFDPTPKGNINDEVKGGLNLECKAVQKKAKIRVEGRFANSYSAFTESTAFLPPASPPHHSNFSLPNGRNSLDGRASLSNTALPHFKEELSGE